ncbi:MAG: four-carbon acid sugar kinase family protein [Christensenellaceae bacterium]|jgi:uncharacterized protein YgbK (DUF1537 family)|nr:four-carbon acid sugar kinase family protein [Christensenellaceae bacterium]
MNAAPGSPVRLLLLADDLTGALDSGAALSQQGIETLVAVERDFPLAAAGADALVLNLESRHLPPKEAYGRCFAAARQARRLGIPFAYKKTDSALRGNPGPELCALRDAFGQNLAFVPAFPAMNRYLRGSTLFIEGVPVAESPFGRDPFNPVTHSALPDILGCELTLVPSGQAPKIGRFPALYAFEGKTRADLAAIARRLRPLDFSLAAGCAGFAEFLPLLWDLPTKALPGFRPLPQLLVLCGSLNEFSLGQLGFAERAGAFSLTLGERELENPALLPLAQIEKALRSGCAILRTQAVAGPVCEARRAATAEALGRIAALLIAQNPAATPFLIGGDTLLAAMRAMRCQTLQPLSTLAPGVVLCHAQTPAGQLPLLTKSGGLGPVDVIPRAAAFLSQPQH